MASVESICLAKKIVESDSERNFVVVSAPGKSANYPRKVTDMLIDAHTRLCYSNSFDACETIFARFKSLADGFGINIDNEIQRTREEIFINKCQYDFVVSRGEYLMAILFAKIIGYKFLDAATLIVIKPSGKVDLPATRANFARLCKRDKYVMGGFYGRVKREHTEYGSTQYGRAKHGKASRVPAEYGSIQQGSKEQGQSLDGIKIFARGGSDLSGAIAAVCLRASLYENFTDTYGVQTANPAIVKNTDTVSEIDYSTLYKLCLGGASVIFPDCVPLLKAHNVPLLVDNTFDYGKNFTIVGSKKNVNPYFSLTYETKRNINKDTVEILCVKNKVYFSMEKLCEVLGNKEVYLVSFSKNDFRLIAPVANFASIINVLHKALTASKSIASVK